MSGYHDGQQHGHGGFHPSSSSPPAPAGARGPVQRKPVASMSQSTLSAGPPIPQQSVDVASGRQERYTVSPASSIHRDRESQTGTEHQEVLSPISQGAGNSPERVAAAPNYQQQWQRGGSVRNTDERGFLTPLNESTGDKPGPWQPQLPALQQQNVIQWPPEFTQPSWNNTAENIQPTNIALPPVPVPVPVLMPGQQWPESETQQELAEARAREMRLGYGPTMMSYGPAPPVEDRGIAPIRFTLPVLYPQSQGFETIPIPPRPTTVVPTTTSHEARHYGSSNDARDLGKETGGYMDHVEKPQQTKTTTAKERKHSPFMHYEDIDYFGPEPESEPDSPDLELEQEKLKFAEAQFRIGEQRTSPRGKERMPTTTTAEISSSVTPVAGPQMVEDNSVSYSPPTISEAADTLQMGVKARRSWERQQRRQAKKHQQHQHQEPAQMATIGTANPITMIMRIPSMISTGGRGGGSSIGGGGSYRGDNHSRNGDTGGGPGDEAPRVGEGNINSANNTYYTHDYRDQNLNPLNLLHHSISNPHSNRNGNHINPSPPKPTDHNNNNNPPTQSILTPWISEILWSLLSLASLIAITLTLRAFDGKSITPPDWPISPNVTLNTLLAFLTAICQLALLIPVTQGLAQLKWNWFARAAPGGIPKRERPLEDFALFDDAAFGTGRGGGWPWAALRLLFSGKGRTLGVGAAVVLVTSFLSGPITQGVVGYRVGVVPVAGNGNDSFAVVSRSGGYFVDGEGTGLAKREEASGETTLTLSQQKLAIQQAIYYNPYQSPSNLNHPILPPLLPQCTTPSCQFPLFTSLAICTTTADISSHLTISPLNSTATQTLGFRPDDISAIRLARLPNGPSLLGSPDTCNLNISSASQTLAFTNHSTTLANLFVIYADDDDAPTVSKFKAAEVLFYFCVNTYNVSITQGNATTTIVGSSSTAVLTNTTDTKTLHLQDPLSRTNQTIPVNLAAAGSLQRTLVSLLRGTYSAVYGEQMGGLTGASEVLGRAMYGEGRGGSPTTTTTTTTISVMPERSTVPVVGSRAAGTEGDDVRLLGAIGWLMGNVAGGLTNALRSTSTSTQIPGTPLTPTTAIRIQYPYLAFLALQVLLSIAFLIGIIIQTAVWKVPVLKGSSIATLLAISSRDRALLEQQDQGLGGEGRNINTGGNVHTRRVRLRLGSIGSGGGTGVRGGWFLDSSGAGAGNDAR